MRKLILVIAAMLFVGMANGQDSAAVEIVGYTTPNYEQIKKDCNDKTSPRYYPNLVKRFAEVDTNLDVTDMQTFYYGQAFLDGYSPYPSYDEFEEIQAIMSKDEAPTIADSRNIIKLANTVIAQNPAEPMAYYYKFVGQNIACKYFGGDTLELQKVQLQFQMLFYTIASTGNGTTPELAMHVVNPSHEYMMMSMYGFHEKEQVLVSFNGSDYDMFVIDTNEYGVDTLYFNIDRITGAWDKLLFSDEEEESETVTGLFLELGEKFVLELKKPKRNNSQFVVVSKEKVSDTLVCERDSLFREPVPKNQVVGYFCPMRLSEDDETVFNCLVLVSNCGKKWLYYDTYISTDADGKTFSTTSNNGIPRGVLMNEMWPTDVKILNINNIRTKE